jgi:hypothetical protein
VVILRIRIAKVIARYAIELRSAGAKKKSFRQSENYFSDFQFIDRIFKKIFSLRTLAAQSHNHLCVINNKPKK